MPEPVSPGCDHTPTTGATAGVDFLRFCESWVLLGVAVREGAGEGRSLEEVGLAGSVDMLAVLFGEICRSILSRIRSTYSRSCRPHSGAWLVTSQGRHNNQNGDP